MQKLREVTLPVSACDVWRNHAEPVPERVALEWRLKEDDSASILRC